jgi:thiol:disulfide interchange protein DsbC
MRFSHFLTAAAMVCASTAWAAPAGDTVLSTAPESTTAPEGQGLSTAALAPEQAQAITTNFESRFPGIHVDLVRGTPMPGLYEIQVGMDLLYSDADANYVLQGSLIDARSRTDLTAERLEVLQRVSFDSLPLERAIKQVKGDGSRVMAVFEDPNCGYCKQLHQTLRDVDNVTVYTFLFPILSVDSVSKSRDIWCASDRAQAWTAWRVEGQAAAEAKCVAPIEANLGLGRKLNIQGTPAV